MRVHGTLIKWNGDRGFGFIKPAKGDSEVFVHISAFPKDGARPNVGELISYEMEVGNDGRQRAVHVMRPGQRPSARPAPVARQDRSRGQRRFGAWALLVAAGLGAYGYSQYSNYSSRTPVAEDFASELPEASSRYSCDGRTHCSQMTSCEEATYFIEHCANTEMDGDNDGVPCEKQWCRRF